MISLDDISFLFDLDKRIVYLISGFIKTGRLKTGLSPIMKNVGPEGILACCVFNLSIDYPTY